MITVTKTNGPKYVEEAQEFLQSDSNSTVDLQKAQSLLTKYKRYIIPSLLSLISPFCGKEIFKVSFFAVLFWILALTNMGGKRNGKIQFTCLKRAFIFMVFKTGYEFVRSRCRGDYNLALQNADRVVAIERWLNLFVEHDIQAFFLQYNPIILFSNSYYETQHFIQVCIGLLLNIIYVESSGLPNEIAFHILNISALVIFYNFPTCPPRLWTSDPDIVFTDTKDPGSLYNQGFQQEGNPFAAVPSMHCAWALWSAFVEIDTTRGWKYEHIIRAWGVFHVLFTAFVTVVTGNHWWMDAVIGWSLCTMALLSRKKILGNIEAIGEMLGRCVSNTPLSFLSTVENFFEEVELTDRR